MRQERLSGGVVKIMVKELDRGGINDEGYIQKLTRGSLSGEGNVALEVYRRIQNRRAKDEKIYDDPDWCSFDGAGGIIIPSGNIDRVIKEEFERIVPLGQRHRRF